VLSAQHSAKPRLNAIRGRKEAKKRGRPRGDRAVELGFGLCLQQKCYGGWGLAEGRRQRAAKEIAKIAGIAKIAD
jgi:hypothetical protein